MNVLQLGRRLLLVSVAAGVLAGCGGGADDIASPGEGVLVGGGGTGGGTTPPPAWATADLLTDAIRAAASTARITGPVVDGRAHTFAFGRQLDVLPAAFGELEEQLLAAGEVPPHGRRVQPRRLRDGRERHVPHPAQLDGQSAGRGQQILGALQLGFLGTRSAMHTTH